MIALKLPSTETLGCATVMCSDKIGALILNEMNDALLVAMNHEFSVEDHSVAALAHDPNGCANYVDRIAWKNKYIENGNNAIHGVVFIWSSCDKTSHGGLKNIWIV